jgi:hypothetical protein
MTRTPRRPPPPRQVAQFWMEHPGTFEVDLTAPQCFRCGANADSWNNFDRAHLVDRIEGGSDHAANLALLCRKCHRGDRGTDTSPMPSFRSGHYGYAVSWVQGEWSPDDLTPAQRRRWLLGDDVVAQIKELAAKAGPLTEEQRDIIRAAFRGDSA